MVDRSYHFDYVNWRSFIGGDLSLLNRDKLKALLASKGYHNFRHMLSRLNKQSEFKVCYDKVNLSGKDVFKQLMESEMAYLAIIPEKSLGSKKLLIQWFLDNVNKSGYSWYVKRLCSASPSFNELYALLSSVDVCRRAFLDIFPSIFEADTSWQKLFDIDVLNKVVSVASFLKKHNISVNSAVKSLLARSKSFALFYDSKEQTRISLWQGDPLLKWLHSDWRRVFPEAVLNKKISVRSFLLSKYKSADSIIAFLRSRYPDFRAFHDVKEQSFIGKGVFERSLKDRAFEAGAISGIVLSDSFPTSQKDSSEYRGECAYCGSSIKYHLYTQGGRWVFVTRHRCSSRKKTGSTRCEDYLSNFIRSMGFDVEDFRFKKPSIIAGSEIDIYIPSRKVGFEIDGLLSHCSPIHPCLMWSKAPSFIGPKSSGRHRLKTLEALKAGVSLYHLPDFSDGSSKKSLIKSFIATHLHRYENVFNASRLSFNFHVGASREVSDFYRVNHFHGPAPTSFSVSLSLCSCIVQAVSFRVRSNFIELVRQATLQNTKVDGGFSLLFSKALNFIKSTYPHKILISYAYLNFTPDPNKSVYSRNGFILDAKYNITHRAVSTYFYDYGLDKKLHSRFLYSTKWLKSAASSRICSNKVSTEFYPESEIGQRFIYNPDISNLQNLYKLHIHPYYDAGSWKYSYGL